MKKQNVIDLSAYRDELLRKATDNTAASTPPLTISEELKAAIETLIDRLRAKDKVE